MNKANVDFEVLMDCLDRGMTQKEAAETLDVSESTISKRIAKIQAEQGILMRYRSLQSLQLTQLQAKVLEAITPEKIAEASLRDLVMAFKILKDHELTIEGKPKELKGLIGYLMQIEREEAALIVQPEDKAIDAEFVDTGSSEETGEYIPKL